MNTFSHAILAAIERSVELRELFERDAMRYHL
jgi:hypothetical protein